MEIFSTPEFWVAVAFVFFVGLLFKPGSKFVIGALDERAERIRSQLDEAQRLREEAQHLLAEYQRKQRQALQDAEAILNQARATAERHREDSAAELAQTLERRERQAMDRIAQAEAEALAEVRAVAVAVWGGGGDAQAAGREHRRSQGRPAHRRGHCRAARQGSLSRSTEWLESDTWNPLPTSSLGGRGRDPRSGRVRGQERVPRSGRVRAWPPVGGGKTLFNAPTRIPSPRPSPQGRGRLFHRVRTTRAFPVRLESLQAARRPAGRPARPRRRGPFGPLPRAKFGTRVGPIKAEPL